MTQVLREKPADAEDDGQILDMIDRWVARELKPIVKEYDHEDRYPHGVVEQMKELGLFGATISPEYGGLGLSGVDLRQDRDEHLFGVDVDHGHHQLAFDAGVGDREIRHIAAKDEMAAEACNRRNPRWSCPDRAGCRHRSAGDSHDAQSATAIITSSTATKVWITNAAEGNCLALLVKTNPEAQPRYNGMSLFIAPKQEGFSVARKLPKLGYKAIDTAEIAFEDYRLPAENLIGGVEGRGFFQVAGGLELGRINVASARRRHCRRRTGSSPVRIRPDPQNLRQADLRAPGDPAEIGRDGNAGPRRAPAHARCCCRRFDRARPLLDMEAGMAKYFATEAALENSIEGMRIHGAYGYSQEFDIERLYRDAPLTCIGEGTNEMQRIIISKQYVKRNPAS